VSNRVHVLLFDAGSEAEGIHSLELNGHTVVLLFEEEDDALRYALLLEAQDFPEACVEAIPREDIEHFCAEAGYEARYVPSGFLPETPEDRLLLAPPEHNLDTNNWKEATSKEVLSAVEPESSASEQADLEAFRRSLEGLL
jgi:hypothetical protein